MVKKNLQPSHFLNRELGLLEFNRRVLAQAADDAVPLLDAWKKQFPLVRLSCVGRITAQPGLKLCYRSGVRELSAAGYAHFD